MPTPSAYNYARYDARDDLGYGRLSPSGFNAPRSYIQYPQGKSEEQDADEVDDETYEMVLDKLLDYMPSDPYAVNKTDPFYFAGGNTKLSELNTAKGMVPFPRMYHGKQAVSGGTAQRLPAGPTQGFRTRIRPTGTKKGYSSAPYPIPELESETGDKFTLQDFLDTNKDEEHLDRVRELIRVIHDEQGN